MGCDCCKQPSCPAPVLRWDSASVSKSAPSCYFDPFIANPDKKFKKRVILAETVWNGADVNSRLDAPDFPYPVVNNHYDSLGTQSKEETWDYSTKPCGDSTAYACDGPGKGTYDCSWNFGPPAGPGEGGDVGSSHATINTCTGVYTWGATSTCLAPFSLANCPAPTVTSLDQPDTETVRVRGSSSNTVCDHTEDFTEINNTKVRRWGSTWSSSKTTTTLSEPYLFADLLAEAIGALPALDDDFDDTAGSFYNRSGWTASLRKSAARIEHQACCYLKVWIDKVFTPKGGGAPIVTPESPYVHEATGNPCWPDPEKSVNDAANRIKGDPMPLNVPDEEGSVTYTIRKWSCVNGYEPAEGEPNGFPTDA